MNKRLQKIVNNIKIYQHDIETKGLYWSIVHRLYVFPVVRQILTPIINTLKPSHLNIEGNKFYIDKWDDVISQELILSHKWEEYETELFKKNIKKGDIILDIGAHIGYYTLIAARIVGSNGRVYAFEPDPKNFSLLKKNVEENRYKNVVLINKAVSDTDGDLKLFLASKNTGDHRIYKPKERRKSVKIQSITLDNFFKNNYRVDLIKLDIQGSEVRAIKGGQKIIKLNKNIKILTEFWPRGLKLSGSSANEYIGLLTENKFQIYDVNKDKKATKLISAKKLLTPIESDVHDFRNIFCVKKDI
ncbi:MAG: FkbM family methyltransferase [bacterium]|nr:FkbM family methyltransferase [bacterium]